MSAFIAIIDELGACILSDAAVSRNGVLDAVEAKTHVSAAGDLAVTFVGAHWLGMTITEDLLAMANEIGAEGALANLQVFVDQIRTSLPGMRLRLPPDLGDHEFEANILVSAYLPGRGGVLRQFRTVDGSHQAAAEPAFVVYDRPRSAATHKVDLAAAGVPMKGSETTAAWLSKHGGAVMDHVRRQRVDYRGVAGFGVGGRCDLTVISAGGATVECIKWWPDVIGEVIDPIRDMSRSERRRLERMVDDRAILATSGIPSEGVRSPSRGRRR